MKTAIALFCVWSISASMLAPSANADIILWYNGDYPAVGGPGTGNQEATNTGSLNVFDDFTVSQAGWIVNRVWSNNSMSILGVTQASWSIRTGMSGGNGGTVVASGISNATQTPTGRTGIPHGAEYTIEVAGLNVALAPGSYWLSVAPVVGTDPFTGGFLGSYLSSTNKANAIGDPATNNGSLIKTTIDNYASLPNDYSMGIAGIAVVPEPSTLFLTAICAGGIVGSLRRSRLLNSTSQGQR